MIKKMEIFKKREHQFFYDVVLGGYNTGLHYSHGLARGSSQISGTIKRVAFGSKIK